VFTYNELLIISALVETYIYLLYEVYGQSPPTINVISINTTNYKCLLLLYTNISTNK